MSAPPPTSGGHSTHAMRGVAPSCSSSQVLGECESAALTAVGESVTLEAAAGSTSPGSTPPGSAPSGSSVPSFRPPGSGCPPILAAAFDELPPLWLPASKATTIASTAPATPAPPSPPGLPTPCNTAPDRATPAGSYPAGSSDLVRDGRGDPQGDGIRLDPTLMVLPSCGTPLLTAQSKSSPLAAIFTGVAFYEAPGASLPPH